MWVLQDHLGYNLEQMLELMEKAFPKKTEMTWQEIKDHWNVEDPLVIAHYVNHWDKVRDHNQSLELYKRCRYILTETQRTFAIKKLCLDQSIDDETKMVELGKLLDDGQRSSLEEYDCSGPELEEIMSMGREAGAYGGKLSGAGWGGSCVCIVNKDKLKDCLEHMKKYYFREREEGKKLVIDTELENCIFETIPG